jgi:DNA topoisomerase VI subunit A
LFSTCTPFFSELFYNDKSLFQCQPYSNSMLDLLASLLQLRRDELHTDASAKGFIMGELQYELEDFAEADPNEGGSQTAAAASSSSALLALPPALTLVNCETPQVITPFPQQIRGQSMSTDKPRGAKTSSASA